MSDDINVDPGNSFAPTLAQIGHGDVLDLASEKMASLVQAVLATEKKGTFTLTIMVRPRGKDSGQVELDGDVKTVEPTRETAPSMFFVGENGALLRDNPRQRKFPFAESPQRVTKAQ
ncbi:MAG: hypothetical protein QM627_04850 [Luteolibacter sp.]